MDNIVVYSNNKNVNHTIKLLIDNNFKSAKTSYFNTDTLKLQNIIHNQERKIYLIYIEQQNSEGFNIAVQIRESDFKSIIIFIVSYELSAITLSKSNFMFLNMVSIYDSFENNLLKTLNLAQYILNHNDLITISNSKETYFISSTEVLYINFFNNKSYITTMNRKISISASLKELATLLKCDFIQTHKSCYINLANVYKIDYLNNKIIFKNKEECFLLSRRYKKRVKDTLNSYKTNK